MMDWSWTELQALSVKAATGAGVPPAQALAFGAMLARHLADGGGEGPIANALDAPHTILRLAHRVEEMVEAASINQRSVSVREPDSGHRALLVSWLSGLPCQADITVSGHEITAQLTLAAPSTRSRPTRIEVSGALATQLKGLAARTYVPDSATSRASGAGAGLMELD